MKKEEITNISLDSSSGKLTLEYGKGKNSKTIKDEDLTPEQREIKNFFQQTGKNSLSQQELKEQIKNNGIDKIKLIAGISIFALVLLVLGVFIYKKNRD